MTDFDETRSTVTRLLERAEDGEASALHALVPHVYEELKRLASAHLRHERRSHTLQTTALAHEAYLRLVDDSRIEWRGRARFLGLAARSIRRILVDHARRRGARKRGGDRERIPLTEASAALDTPELDVLDLEEALGALAARDERKARVVELRFFAGLTIEECADVLGLSTTTVEDDWFFSRAWLRRRLGPG